MNTKPTAQSFIRVEPFGPRARVQGEARKGVPRMSDDETTLLRALHDQHARPLWRFVVSLTGDRAMADDIVQETLLRAWRKPAVLDQRDASARGWLFTVARNLVIDASRTAQHRHEVGTDELPEQITADGTDALLDSWLVADALSSLSIEHRDVVVRAFYAGRPVAEIARELDIPPGTVKSRLHYALRALRLSLQERGVTR
jgi:RNA polymerase sigma-70 factor (ECF subfamily)